MFKNICISTPTSCHWVPPGASKIEKASVLFKENPDILKYVCQCVAGMTVPIDASHKILAKNPDFCSVGKNHSKIKDTK